jgi:N-formylglutamate deformylase
MHAALQLITQRFRHGMIAPAPASGEPAPMLHALPGTPRWCSTRRTAAPSTPNDFRHACDLATLRQAEDTHVEKLYDFAPALGAAWIEALFPRSYLDANRDTTEVDVTLLDGPWPSRCETDPACCRRCAWARAWSGSSPTTACRSTTAADGRRGAPRIDRCWRPYHAAVAQAIDAAHARHGYSIHLNCHSMPAVAASHATDFPGLAHADFVIGDRDGSTAAPALSHRLCEHLRGLATAWRQPPVQGRGAGAPLRRPGEAPPQHPGGDQPQAVHGRGHHVVRQRRHGVRHHRRERQRHDEPLGPPLIAGTN